jgi:hypothetical protein
LVTCSDDPWSRPVTRNPFDALGLPTDPDLTDAPIHAAWRKIAAATHPDRPDGGDLARYTQASAAYAQLNSPWGRSEAYADLLDGLPDTTPLPPVTWTPPLPRTIRPVRALPARILHGRPLRLIIRAAIAAALSLVVLWLIPGQPAAPADVAGLIAWFAVTGRADLAPPPRR